MMKKLLFTILFIILALPTTSLAHSYLSAESTPAPGDVVDNELTEIELIFNSGIEPLSRFELRNEEEQTIAPDDIIVEEFSMTGKFDKPIENGTYTLLWEAIGADGHPTSGEYSFEVNREEEQPEEVADNDIDPEAGQEELDQSNQQPNEEAPENTADLEEETPVENEADAQEDAAEPAEEGQSFTVLILVLVILIAVIVILGLLKRRKTS